MKFSLAKIILIFFCVIQIISLKFEPTSGLKDFLKVPGFTKDIDDYAPRFKSINTHQVQEDVKPNNKKPNNKKPNGKQNNAKAIPPLINVVDLSSPETLLNVWASIASESFTDEVKFPTILMTDSTEQKIKLRGIQRINEFWSADNAESGPTDEAFWFTMKGEYVYYFAKKSEINALGTFLINSVDDILNHYSELSNSENCCINATSRGFAIYTICFEKRETKLSWLCSLQKLLDRKQEVECMSLKGGLTFDFKPEIKEIKDIQPVMIIPRASRQCNEKWDYKVKGVDWECTCKEGQKQSPIDLPSKSSAELTSVHHLFIYDNVKSVIDFDTIGGFLEQGQPGKISFMKGAVRIINPRLGKIVDDGGGIFMAEEITFHTPSEHKINGEQFDLEMQVIHYGRSVGDIAKQIVLSFLFKKTPGIYNKLFDKINFVDLPNPLHKAKEISEDFSIFQVFYTPDEEYSNESRFFAYYQYDGSLTFPPCTERTQHFVVADPIPLSSTVIKLFQEALLAPDLVGETLLVSDTEGSIENNRDIQPLNDRIVSLYDNKKFGCFNEVKKTTKPMGHYEKRQINVSKYIYLNHPEPSGIPGAIVVPDDEVKALIEATDVKK